MPYGPNEVNCPKYRPRRCRIISISNRLDLHYSGDQSPGFWISSSGQRPSVKISGDGPIFDEADF